MLPSFSVITMSLIRTEKKEALKHVLENVFQLEPDSEIHKALAHHTILDPHDLASQEEDTYWQIMFVNKKGTTIGLGLGDIGQLHQFMHLFAITVPTTALSGMMTGPP